MKNVLIILVTLVFTVVLNVLSVNAREVTFNEIQPLVKNYILSHYKPAYKGEIVVNCDRLPVLPLNVPDGKIEIKATGTLRDKFVQRTIVRVTVFVDGKFRKAVGIPVTLSLYENVWVATQPIQRDEALTYANMQLQRRDISKIAGTAARDVNNLMDKKVLKTFRADEILDHNFIKDTPIVIRNSMVEVVFKSPTVSVTIPCEAMDDGGMGDLVRVKSKDFKKQYTGKVIDKNVIIVNI